MNRPTRRGPGRRPGLALPMVMGLVVFLGLAIAPLLFFSGSQSRSLLADDESWRAAAMARSGLAVASDWLRESRWYGDDALMGRITSEQAAVPGPDRFDVLCEDTRVIATGFAGYVEFPLVHHVDVFSRGTAEGRSVVGYGAFIMTPEPELDGTSSDGAIGKDLTTPDTMKRMVRLVYFREPALQDIESAAVRDAIRERVRLDSGRFLEGYAQVDWGAVPAAPPAATLSVAAARAYLDGFATAPPGEPDSQFLRDRLTDLIIPGTPTTDRLGAKARREFIIRLPENPAKKAEAEFFCNHDASCEWGPFPGPDELHMTVPTATESLHNFRGGTPDADYPQRIRRHDCAQLRYQWGASALVAGTTTSGELAEEFPGQGYVMYGGLYWVSPWARKMPDPCVPHNYQLDDPASGYDLSVPAVFEFFRKYYSLDGAQPLGGSGINPGDLTQLGYLTAPPPPEPEGGGNPNNDPKKKAEDFLPNGLSVIRSGTF